MISVVSILYENRLVLIVTSLLIIDGTGTGRSDPVRSGPGPHFRPAGQPVERSGPVDRRPVGSFF
jgi:hypothetical protein